MVEHFCTCFDSYFLPQGLSLYKSLESHSADFILWIVCLDRKTYDVLSDYALPRIKLLLISDLEDEKLLILKQNRNKSEYIWTLSPFLPKWIFEANQSLKRITYLDADTFFFADPAPIFDEFALSGKAILITEHAFDDVNDQSSLLGRFCVQFIIYNRDGSEEVRQWWEDRCIEWCFARCEDGKFGDQKYLDHWPVMFPEKIHILSRLDYVLAPWNSSRYCSSSLILWHFHGFRLLTDSRILLHSIYKISNEIDQLIYLPYLSVVIDQFNQDTYSPENCLKYNKFKNLIYFYFSTIYKIIINRRLHSLRSNIKIISILDTKKSYLNSLFIRRI